MAKKGVTLLMSLRKKCFCTPAQKSRAIELSELVRKTLKKNNTVWFDDFQRVNNET